MWGEEQRLLLYGGSRWTRHRVAKKEIQLRPKKVNILHRSYSANLGVISFNEISEYLDDLFVTSIPLDSATFDQLSRFNGQIPVFIPVNPPNKACIIVNKCTSLATLPSQTVQGML